MRIRIEQVRQDFSHNGEAAVTVLEIPVFEFESGVHYGINGTSGSGKSTLLNLLSGLRRPTSGRIWVGDMEITSLSESAGDTFRARHFGYIFQSFNLFPAFSALENVLIGAFFAGRKPSAERARALLDAVGLADRMHYRPGQLSAGQQQRVAVARALVNDPAVLLADEPTGNLDPQSADVVMNLIETLSTNKTLILVSHSPEILSRFSQQIDVNQWKSRL